MLTNSLSQKFAYSALVQRPVKLDLNILTFGAFRYQQRHGHTATQRERAQQCHYTTCSVWSALHNPPHHQAHQQWSSFVCAVIELVVLLLLLKTAQEEEQE